NCLQVSRADVSEMLTGSQKGAALRVQTPSRNVQAINIQKLNLDGGKGPHSVTIGYLGDTLIHEVSVNPGKLANPSGKTDTIVINGAPVYFPLTVQREDVIVFPPLNQQ